MTATVELNHQTLCTLAAWESSVLVSAFIPVDFSRPQPTEAMAKALRTIAQTTATMLTAEHGMEPAAAATFVTPLVEDAALEDMPNSARGLAVFLSAERAMYVAVPIAVGPAVEIGDRPDMLRLLPAFVDDIKFFTLTIDKKGAQLFQGSRWDFQTVHVADMPGSIEDALWYIRREPNRQGAGAAHGTGAGAQDLRKDDVRQYIHLIDKAITPALNGSDAPLVVVGVEYEASMFINHTHYRHTVDIPVSGSPDSMHLDELHQRSWEFVRSQDRAASNAVDALRRLAGTGKTAADSDDVVNASRNGAVRDLLVARSTTDGGEIRSTSVEERRKIVVAVNEGLRHQAHIHIVDDDALPDGVHVAAVLRY
jgi:hypothetical protein